MTEIEEATPANAEPRELRADSHAASEPAAQGEHHTLADDMVMVGETIRAILSL